jgi:general secretion pathway protein K
MKFPRQQRGIAVLTAMLVVAIATILAVELIWGTSLDLRRAHMEILAAELLRDDAENSDIDSLTERWAENYGFPFEGGNVVGRLDDMQGRFNLNSLVNREGNRDGRAAAQFRRLIERVGTDFDDVDPAGIVDAVVDWLDPNQLPDGIGGAEDGVYTNRTPPHRAANFWMTSPSELLAVDGMTPDLYDALSQLLSALPPGAEVTAININTAPAEVLRSLSEEVSDSDVENWIESRDTSPFESVEDFLATAANVFPPEEADRNDDAEAAEAAKPVDLTVNSDWFVLSAVVSIGTTRLSMYSLLDRSNQGNVAARLRAFDTY